MRKPFAEYRDPGVEWLGPLPKHWPMSRLRFVADISTGDADTVDAKEDGRYPFFVRSPRVHAIDSYCYDGEAVLLAGDGNVEDTVHHYVGKYDCHQRVYQLNRLRHVEGRYLYYFVGACFGSWIADGTAKSTVASLRMPMLQNFPLPLPPMPEQRRIADYLDVASTRIDRLITMQESLMERLDEYRTALITRVVTKGLPPEAAEAAGLNPAPRLKDSGVEWLGEVPEHWTALHLRHICRFAYGDSLTLEDREQGEIPVYGSNGRVGFHNEANTSAPVIVVGRKGSHGKVNFEFGRAFAIDTTYFVDKACTASDLRWLYYVLMSADLADVSKDSAVPGLSREDAYAKYLPHPPIAEQKAIAEYLDAQSGRIDILRSKAELSVERLGEYRSAVISAAVTGKIDVRDEALPGVEGGV